MFRKLGVSIFTVLAILLAITYTFGAPLLKLESGTFDLTARGSATNYRELAATSSSPYRIIQCKGPILPNWRQSIENAGAKILGYLPDYAYLVKATPTIESKISKYSFVRATGAYLPRYKISPSLSSVPAAKTVEITVLLHPGENVNFVKTKLELAGAVLMDASTAGAQPILTVEAPGSAIKDIAAIDAVQWLEYRAERKLLNDVARSITKVNDAWVDTGLYGAGQIVAVADTGLDTGVMASLSQDFAGRIQSVYALGRPGNWSDTHGHGTHTSGTVLGNGRLSGSNPATHSYATSFAGVAPEAKLVMQSIMDSSGGLGGLPSDLNDLFLQAYNDGARVHSNSWGADVYGAYTTDSRNVDMFMWNHKDMVIVFAAGNAGSDSNADGKIDADSMGSPATAKNCITVGATENFRLSGGVQMTYGDAFGYPAPPISTDLMSNNADGMAAFSSRGPCDDGRIKPDICAPGTNVISCRSHASGAGVGWGAYNADYCYSGGTSMACPHVAGAAALVRQFFIQNKGWSYVSAAMVKAALINGARDMTPGQYGTGSKQEISRRPDQSQGWGKLDLYNTFKTPTSGILEFDDHTTGLTTGQTVTYEYQVSEGDALHFTLVWTDYPATTGAGTKLVNDLDMLLTAPDGTKYYPNGRTSADHVNNIEDIIVDADHTTTGKYTLTVTAFNIASSDPQPYALVQRLTPGLPDLSSSTKTSSPTGGVYGGQTITYTIRVRNTGAPSSNTVVTDPIPDTTTYVPNSTTLNGVPVDDTGGVCPLVTGLVVNSPGSDPGVIRRGYDAVITFQVIVNDGLDEGTPIENTATITADDGVSVQVTALNRIPRKIRVMPGGTGDGSSWDYAKPTILAALQDAFAGDEIWVAAGTYIGAITVPDGMKLYGGFAGTETSQEERNPEVNISIIDAKYAGSAVTVAEGATSSTVIDGFTIRNGKGTKVIVGNQTMMCGGGIYSVNASPIIAHNRITANNVTHRGGGIYCVGGAPTIVDNLIYGNIARTQNYTGYGGGIYCATSDAVIERNSIFSNRANPSGGGIACAPGASPTIMYNTFTDNGAMWGGAVFCDTESKPLVANNWIIGNKATLGGGFFCGRSADASFINNTLVRNYSSPGGAIAIYSAQPIVANNIVTANAVGISKAGNLNTPTLANNCVYKNLLTDYLGISAGATDIMADPMFVSATTGDYRLSALSPCIDAGVDTYVQPDWTDVYGNLRISGTNVDIGAYEYQQEE